MRAQIHVQRLRDFPRFEKGPRLKTAQKNFPSFWTYLVVRERRMDETHTLLHQITSLLGIKQCTSTQILGICLEFWVGGLVAVGAIKAKALLGIKRELEKLKAKKKIKRKRRRKK